MTTANPGKVSVWDRHVASLTGKVVSGGAILPIPTEGLQQSTARKAIIHAQRGITLRIPEATAIVDAVMDGKIHRDYVIVGGQQYMITTVAESAYYGRYTSSPTPSGIVLVKTRRALVLAIYSEPVVAADAIPHVHEFADDLERVCNG